MHFAHSGRNADKSDWQNLKSHLLNVARLAADIAEPFDGSRLAHLAGLLHDLGKYTSDFQRRLENEKIRVDHSTAGAALLLSIMPEKDRGIAELIAYGIAGHHAGLPDKSGESPSSLMERLKGFHDVLDPAWKTEIKVDTAGLLPALRFEKAHAAFQFAFLGRMIFSCLVDADFKDTEAYYRGLEGRKADRDWRALQDLLPQFLAAFDSYMARLPRDNSPVNRLRGEILGHIRDKACEKPGLFTLTVPTGGGKTLASLAFALDHARIHGLRRIIYAIPFTSIIDQTAAIFRAVLGEDHVLEHHSAIDEETLRERQSRDKLKLAMEDWAAPVVVTTNVQFFESLFAARPSKARKLHNIAGSVIILDEAQTLPLHLLSPCVRTLDELARNYGCTIVLCTATQPALDESNFSPSHPAGLKLAGRELAPDPQQLNEKLRRVSIRHGGEMPNEALISELTEAPQALVIVNSRKHALALYREAQAAGLSGVIHLSTRQYAVHRREILARIRELLKVGEPCRVIATSLVEAGVDLDFPRVWRAEAGLDQIAQAAGRCNREGRRLVGKSIVTIFSTPDFPPPAEIRGLTGDMKRMAGKHADLFSPAALGDYFGEVYWRKGPQGLDRNKIIERFKLGPNATDFAYRSVAEEFRMIESGMMPVIIARDEPAKVATAKLAAASIPSGILARQLQPYVVSVPAKARDLLIRNGRVQFLRPELRGDQFALLLDESLYTEVGLLWEDAEYLQTEGLVI